MNADGLFSTSPNGSLLKDLINQYSMDVLNFSELCSGKWTRSECKKGITEKSVLDYVIVRNPMTNSLSKILIDEERIISPYWTRTTKKSGEIMQHSDHNAITIGIIHNAS